MMLDGTLAWSAHQETNAAHQPMLTFPALLPYSVKFPEPLEFPKKYRETMKISALTGAYLRLMERSARRAMPRPDSFADFLKREIYSVSDKISEIKSRLKKAVRLDFAALFLGVRTRSEIVATFLAVLELVSDKKIRISDAGDMNYEIEAAERRF